MSGLWCHSSLPGVTNEHEAPTTAPIAPSSTRRRAVWKDAPRNVSGAQDSSTARPDPHRRCPRGSWLSLHRSGREALDELLLRQEEQDHARQEHEHRGGEDELVAELAEAEVLVQLEQADREGPQVRLVRDVDQRTHEVVP